MSRTKRPLGFGHRRSGRPVRPRDVVEDEAAQGRVERAVRQGQRVELALLEDDVVVPGGGAAGGLEHGLLPVDPDGLPHRGREPGDGLARAAAEVRHDQAGGQQGQQRREGEALAVQVAAERRPAPGMPPEELAAVPRPQRHQALHAAGVLQVERLRLVPDQRPQAPGNRSDSARSRNRFAGPSDRRWTQPWVSRVLRCRLTVLWGSWVTRTSSPTPSSSASSRRKSRTRMGSDRVLRSW